MRGLYAIVDADFLEAAKVALVPFAEQVLTGRPAILQLRAKHAPARQVVEWLRALRPLCTRASALLFANDRPDLALLAGCDGVHVGQEDLAVRDVRRFAPDLAVGVSTHDDAQLEAALVERPTYVAFGPVFGTTSKERPDAVVGLDGLGRAARLAREADVPLVAIGGIDVARAPLVAAHAPLVAVISALLPEGAASDLSRVAHRTRELSLLLAR